MMSALGHKRTYAVQQPMSALLSIATAKADYPAKSHVRFTPESGHVQRTSRCPLCAKRGHDLLVSRSHTLKPLSPPLPLWVGEIWVKREAGILHQGIDAKMKSLGRLAAFSDIVEGAVELRQIFDL